MLGGARDMKSPWSGQELGEPAMNIHGMPFYVDPACPNPPGIFIFPADTWCLELIAPEEQK